MLQIKNLDIVHKRDLRIIIEKFSLSVNPGDKIVIIGEEGNGKSTLLKWIYNEELIDEYTEFSGERLVTNEKLAYLPQELADADKNKSIYEYMTEEHTFWDKTPKELNSITNSLMLPKEFYFRDQKMGTLSGGERVKVQLSRILLSNPSVLLLDEPSNDIDVYTLAWLERFILGYPNPIIYISHDETLIEKTANRIVHLERIRRKTRSRYTVANMPYKEYIRDREARMNNQRKMALEDRREKKIRDEKLQKLMNKVEHNLRSVSRQEPHTGKTLKKKMNAVKSMEKRYDKETDNMTEFPEEEDAIFMKFDDSVNIANGKKIIDLELDELYSLENDNCEKRVLVRNIKLMIRGKEKICIIGKNGIGKSTLMKYILDELKDRIDIKVEYMSQKYEEQLDMEQTPVEYLTVGGDKDEVTKIRTYLGSLKYTIEEMDRPIKYLSGGQKAKIFLMKLCLSKANVLLLDEPTRNFSPLSNPIIRRLLKEYKGSIVSISHDRKYIDEVCDTVYEMSKEGLVKCIRKEGGNKGYSIS